MDMALFKTLFFEFVLLARNVIFSDAVMARNVRYCRDVLGRIGLTLEVIHSQKEFEMFTVLSNIRNTNLYLIAALAIALVAILSLAVVPSIAAPKAALIPVTGIAESPDYYQRHQE